MCGWNTLEIKICYRYHVVLNYIVIDNVLSQEAWQLLVSRGSGAVRQGNFLITQGKIERNCLGYYMTHLTKNWCVQPDRLEFN